MKTRKPRKLSGRRRVAVQQSRRATIYKMELKKHYGKVPCFCCGEHVEPDDATLEHKLPQAHGGTDAMDNLAISHRWCNNKRGAPAPEGKRCVT